MKPFMSSLLLAICIQFSLHAQYDRVVSLAPSLTKSIYFLGAQQKLIGCTTYCKTKAEDKVEIVSSPMTVNVEKVASLKPDLVLATSITGDEYIDMLKKFGIRVEVFPTPSSYEEIGKQFVEIGNLLGKEDLAKHIVDSINNEINIIRQSIDNGDKPKVFFQIGAKPLYTVIPHTFMNDYITLSNAVNIAADLKRGSISRESVLVRKPEYIFIVTMGIVGEDEMKVWKEFTNLPAIQKGQIYIIDSDLACTPTPQTFLQTFRIINNLINK